MEILSFRKRGLGGKKKKAKMSGYLHIYGQDAWHDPVIIVADRQALEALKANVEVALSGKISVTKLFTADGEGFDFIIKPASPEGYKMPYMADYAQDKEGCDPFEDKEIVEAYKQSRENLRKETKDD